MDENWSVPEIAAPVTNYLENYWPCASALSAVNAIGTQLYDLINSILTRWRSTIEMDAVAESGRDPASQLSFMTGKIRISGY